MTYQAQNKSINGNDVVLPDDVVDRVDALVDVRPAGRVGHLKHEVVAELTQVRRQRPGTDAFQDPGLNKENKYLLLF